MTGAVTATLAACWFGLGVSVAWRHRPPPERLRGLGAGVGRSVPALIGSGPRRLFGRTRNDALDAQTGWAILSALGGVGLIGLPGVALAAASWAISVHRRRLIVRRQEAAVTTQLPDVIDLLSLGLRSGLSVRATIELVVPHLSGVVADAFDRAVDAAARGESFTDALSELPRVDPRLRPLAGLLSASLREGDSIVDGLDRLASDARAAERRSQEERARRLPVTMLLPLVFGVLPAFVLLTIVPVVASGVVSLRLP